MAKTRGTPRRPTGARTTTTAKASTLESPAVTEAPPRRLGRTGRPIPPNAGKGRVKGSQNKVTKAFKALLTETYQALEGEKGHGILAWAKRNPDDFYKLCARLIPYEITGKAGADLVPKVMRVILREGEEVK